MRQLTHSRCVVTVAFREQAVQVIRAGLGGRSHAAGARRSPAGPRSSRTTRRQRTVSLTGAVRLRHWTRALDVAEKSNAFQRPRAASARRRIVRHVCHRHAAWLGGTRSLARRCRRRRRRRLLRLHRRERLRRYRRRREFGGAMYGETVQRRIQPVLVLQRNVDPRCCRNYLDDIIRGVELEVDGGDTSVNTFDARTSRASRGKQSPQPVDQRRRTHVIVIATTITISAFHDNVRNATVN